ncbi:anti-sigma factor [Phytohabitans rumicis]|uniref:Anti-sigma K factor RskA C-terminal domain-containing protein n=1 Tax=Phytohabitans rumicis TaxID=1076125 RepID=A0A6V8KVH1_9ACTN|nr:anti-sigma factor [Phytohabitans rumicis]GFJ86718.1 hypothetical protein Prum_003600 [Phytohabitans rumicis]
MNTDADTGPAAEDALVERLAGYLEQRATGDRTETDTDADDRDEALFAALTESLTAAHTWAEPPAGMRDNILAAVLAQPAPAGEPAAEAAVTIEDTAEPTEVEDTGEPSPPPVPVRRRRRWSLGWLAPRPRLAWAVPMAVLVAAVYAAAVLAADRALQPDPPRGERYVATGTELAPDATATVSIRDTGSGFSIVVTFDHLPAAAPGSYYAAWLRGPATSVPIGSFHERRPGTPVELWSGVDPKAYDTFVITLQTEGAPPTPSALKVMIAPLTP